MRGTCAPCSQPAAQIGRGILGNLGAPCARWEQRQPGHCRRVHQTRVVRYSAVQPASGRCRLRTTLEPHACRNSRATQMRTLAGSACCALATRSPVDGAPARRAARPARFPAGLTILRASPWKGRALLVPLMGPVLSAQERAMPTCSRKVSQAWRADQYKW